MSNELLKAVVVVLNGLLRAVVAWSLYNTPPIDEGGILVRALGVAAPASALWLVLRR